jgi:two-component system, NarL family, sensor histidine kinase UhpB
MRVLIVDDDKASRKLLSAQLEAEGLFVSEASDGLQALEFLKSNRVDGVVSDVLMPRLDGYRLCAEIRRDPKLHSLPFIIFSGTFFSPENERLAQDVGADAFFDKSAKPKVLVTALELAASRGSGRRERIAGPDELQLVKEYSELLVQKLEEKRRDLDVQTTALTKSEEQNRLLAAVVESSEDAIISKSLDGVILSWNQGATRLYGYESDEMIGKSIDILIPPERQHEMRNLIRQAKTGSPCPGFETVRIRKGGSPVEVSVRFSPIKNKTGEIFGVSIIARDISHETEMRRKLLASESELRALAARLETIRENEAIRIAREVHDELGQSLTAFNMDLLWLEKKVGEQFSPAEAMPLFERMKRMLELVERTTLAVQRISAELRPGILDDLGLTAALEWYADQFEERSGIICEWKSKQDLPALSGRTATAFFRIFQEIMTNVARHSRATAVAISLQQIADRVTLEVRDNGKGFPREKIDNSKSLGLIGMRERAAFVGGSVDIKSAEGDGTLVRVSAPLD